MVVTNRFKSDKWLLNFVVSNADVNLTGLGWQDFAHYKSGVYKHLYGDMMGGHAVKLIGWGTTDDGVDYWVRFEHWPLHVQSCCHQFSPLLICCKICRSEWVP